MHGRIERLVYNRRVRKLNFKLEEIRQKMVDQMQPESNRYIVDSMLLEVCRLSRANRSNACQEYMESSPNFGFCAAQDMRYFGYIFQAVYTLEGAIKMFYISKASLHDIHYLNGIQDAVDHCVLVGDKGYLSQQWQSDLFQTSSINLQTSMRKNQLNFRSCYQLTVKRENG